jgi:hypothetical protein
VPELDVSPGTLEAARHGLGLLHQRFERLRAAGGLAGRSVTEAVLEFQALCEGLATIELRSPQMLGDDPEGAWRRSIATLVRGFADPPA